MRFFLAVLIFLAPLDAAARAIVRAPVGAAPVRMAPLAGTLAAPALYTQLPGLSLTALPASSLPSLTALPASALPASPAQTPQASPRPASRRGLPTKPAGKSLNPALRGLESLTDNLRKNEAPSPAAAAASLMRFFSGADFSAVNSAAPVPGNPARIFARQILNALMRHGGDPVAAEPEILQLLAAASASGQLEPGLRLLLDDGRVAQHLPAMDAARKDAYAHRFAKIVAAELAGAGLTPGADPFEEWEARGARQMNWVRRSAFAPRGPGEASLLTEERFIDEMERLTGVSFSAGNAADIHSDGTAAYDARNTLIRNAKRSVNLMAWAIYDDKAGRETVDLLIAKHKQGVKVRVMVDGQTITDSGHGLVQIARLEAAGIDVIRFRDPARPYDGLHSKLLLIDGVIAVAGGRNVGDPYLHTDPSGEKWRDMDVRYEGPAAADSMALFGEIWDAQLRAQKLPFPPFGEVPTYAGSPRGSARLAVGYQQPGERAAVLLGMLKAIAGASKRINIENAYFISFPAVRTALLEALARGVEVNILTNSGESVDQPIVVVPILESLPELIDAGANVYIMRAEMLHSKFMTVDGVYANVTSYNIHPRSERYEHEMAVAGLDRELTAALDADFARGTAAARKISRSADLEIPRSPLSAIVRRYLFNQL